MLSLYGFMKSWWRISPGCTGFLFFFFFLVLSDLRLLVPASQTLPGRNIVLARWSPQASAEFGSG
jgi:hypothetical protein